MSGRILLVLLGLCALIMEDATSSLWAQGAYPRVMSPTGRFYGPTQAHYQYERQYGHPWHGSPAPYHPNTGAQINIQVPNYGGLYGAYHIGNLPYVAYGSGYQNYGFPIFGNGGAVFNGYSGYHSVYQSQTGFGGLQQYYNVPPFQYSWQPQFQQQFQQQLPSGQFPRDPLPPPPGGQGFGRLPDFVPAPAPRGHVINVRPVGPEEPVISKARQLLPPQPSSLDQKARSLHFQGQGDIWFQKQNFLQAYSRYKQAASAAADLAAPRFRMAYALIALKRYELAVTEMVRGIQLDPNYPVTGDGPTKVMGPENQIAANALPSQVADWVRQDMRSPDRLFLLGAILRMNGDVDRSQVCFEAAAQLGNQPEPVLAFLRAGQPANRGNSGRPRIPDDDRPPVPEAVEELLKNNRDWVADEARKAPIAGNRAPAINRPIGPNLIGPPNLVPTAPTFAPEKNPETGPGFTDPATTNEEEEEVPPVAVPKGTAPRQEEPAPDNDPNASHDSDAVEPVSGTQPAPPMKPKSTAPGFQPIPKKGSSNKSGNDESEPSGPIIPNPQSGT